MGCGGEGGFAWGGSKGGFVERHDEELLCVLMMLVRVAAALPSCGQGCM